MPRKLAEHQRAVARIKALRAAGKITEVEAARLLAKARLAYEAYALRFEHITGR